MRTGNLYCCLLIGILFLLIGSSCEKDGNKSPESIIQEKISGKWLVTGDNIYKWVEFDKCGNYFIRIISKSGHRYYKWGTCILKDDTTIDLLNFGTLTISSIDENSFNFIVKELDETPTAISALKSKEYDASKITNLLCTQWRVSTINGERFEDVNGRIIYEDDGVTHTQYFFQFFIFTNAGSLYLIHAGDYDLVNDLESYGWMWKDNEKTIGLTDYDYSHDLELDNLGLSKDKLVLNYFGTELVLVVDCDGK